MGVPFHFFWSDLPPFFMFAAGRYEEQQRQLDEAALLGERLKAFEASLHRTHIKKEHKT